MDVQKIDDVLIEMERLERRLIAAKASQLHDQERPVTDYALTAAVRRASMDLTRALAALRKS